MAIQSISSVFAERALCAPNEIMVTDEEGDATAGEIDLRANKLARALRAEGARRDDLVEVSLPNNVAFVVACLAVWRVGATPMPLNPTLGAAECNCLAELAEPRLRIGAPVPGSTVPSIVEDDAMDQSDTSLPDCWATSWKAPVTSGSTGRPKVVISTTPALVDPDAPVAPFFPRRATQLITSPLWHSTAFTYAFRGLTSGHRLVLHSQFDEYRFLSAIAAHQVTWAVLSPPSIHRLVRLSRSVRSAFDMSSLEQVLHIGGRCPRADKTELIDWLGAERVVEVYAGTESNGLTMVGGREWLERPGTVGRGVAGTQLSIRNDGGEPVPPGEHGTIWMRRGDEPAYSYLGAESRRTGGGWDTLGDLGFLDEGGYLYVLDREADVIHADSDVIFPADVEQLVEELPQVRGAVVYAEYGETDEPTLSVVADTAHARLDRHVVADRIEERFGRRWRPLQVTLTDTPLRNDAGKIRRRSLVGCVAADEAGSRRMEQP